MSDNDYDNIRDFHIHCLGVLIAVIDTTFEPLKLFIFYRSLISKLRGCAMSPSNEMAGALGISYDNYRKIDSRNKEAALSLLNEIEHGLSTNLDESQSLLALRVENDYEQLLEIIKELYEKALDQLECKEAVWDLRRRPHTKTHRIEYSMGIPDEYDENGNKIYHGPEIEIDFSDMSIKQQRWVTLIGFLNDK